MGALGGPELLSVLVIVLLVFGSTRLPKLARSIGEAQRELRQAQRDVLGD
ncbi:MAG TPA: twin-arginine translocase TatA/TatE family subunit [Acidimicrobiales bacterium]|nr:twin-arginine translocase TatA/TatE family subunit [Acidimicrobiales bacterium]